MLVARAALEDGTDLLIVGLSRENRERLAIGQPIDLSRATHGMTVPDNLRIVLFAGETEASMRDTLQSFIGASTVQGQMKPQ